jgi:DNA-binding NarL/FixJ family response regulator
MRPAESGVKRNIPGPCGKALGGNGNRDDAMSGGTHLELEERERLAALKAEGLSLRGIARALGRAASTISRELRRNALPKGG